MKPTILIISLLARLAVPASAGAEALKFARVAHCYAVDDKADESKGWCIEGKHAPGIRVSVLGKQRCVGVTGEPQTISDMMGDMTGTKLKDFKCPDWVYTDQALLGFEVRDYKPLPVRSIQASDAPKGMEQRVRQTEAFKKLLAEAEQHRQEMQTTPLDQTLRVFEISISKKRKAYVASFSEEGHLPFLIQGAVVRPLEDNGKMCTAEPNAFRLNGRVILALSACLCGTDGCGMGFTELEQ